MRPSPSLGLLLVVAAGLVGGTGCAQGVAPIRPGESAPIARPGGAGAPASVPASAPPGTPAATPAAASRKPPPAADLPEWLRLRLAAYDAQPAVSAPLAVYQIPYGGGVAYYLRAGCCDQPDPLLNADGVLVCHPGGGITGRGDGKCPGALPPAAQWREVWRHR